jgi:hypothetical protein
MPLRVVGSCCSFDGDLLVKVDLIIFCERCLRENFYVYGYL